MCCASNSPSNSPTLSDAQEMPRLYSSKKLANFLDQFYHSNCTILFEIFDSLMKLRSFFISLVIPTHEFRVTELAWFCPNDSRCCEWECCVDRVMEEELIIPEGKEKQVKKEVNEETVVFKFGTQQTFER